MSNIKLYFFSIILSLSFSGCFGTIMLAGSAASAASTTQEVDEEYGGNLWDYISDKYNNLVRYIDENTDED